MATDKRPERRLTEALLHISDETFLKELEPFDCCLYSGLDEAVCGWARVAPLSYILLTQQKYRRPPNEAADNPNPSSVDAALLTAESSTNIAEHCCGSQTGRRSTLKKSTVSDKQVDSLSDAVVVALQLDAPEWPVIGAMQGHILLTKLEEEGTLRETSVQPRHLSSKYLDNRLSKLQKNNLRHKNTAKNSLKPSNALVPITNFTFFPPIKPPHLNPKVKGHVYRTDRMFEDTCFMFDKKSDTRGAGVDTGANNEFHNYSAALTSIYRTCQHKPVLFSAVSVAVPKTSSCMRPVK